MDEEAQLLFQGNLNRKIGIAASYTCAGDAPRDVIGCREEADSCIDFNKEPLIKETESV
ncbi:MAG: hypothetical protein ACI4R9_02150 [Kiritimatiellia bacterium]